MVFTLGIARRNLWALSSHPIPRQLAITVMKSKSLSVAYIGSLHALLALTLIKSDFVDRVENRIARTAWISGDQSVAEIKPAYKYVSRPKDAAILWQNDLRTVLAKLLGISEQLSARSSSTVPFDVLKLKSEERRGVRSDASGSQTPFSYRIEELRLSKLGFEPVDLILTVPTNVDRPMAAIVLIAGHGSTMHTPFESANGYYQIGRSLAELGYVTISTSVADHTEPPPPRTLIGDRLIQLLTCVDFLMTLDVVDKDRVGCAGKSLGGEMAMWLGAFDQRIKATVSSGFLTQIPQLLAYDHCACWNFPGLTNAVEFSDVYSLIAPRPLQCQNGLREHPSGFPVSIASVAFREIELIYKDFGAINNVEFIAFEGGHELDTRSLVSFFDRYLREESVIDSSASARR